MVRFFYFSSNYNCMNYLHNVGSSFLMIGEMFRKPTKWSVMKQLILKDVEDLIVGSIGIVAFISFFVGGVVTIQTALNINNPLIPKYLVGFATRQSVILEFAPTFISWHDEIYKQGFSRSAGASFSGGTEKGNFYASVGYNDQGGIVENSRLKNGNFSINLNQDLSDKLTINTKLNAFYSTGNFAQDGDRAGGQRSFVGNILRYPTLVTNGGTFDNEDGISSPFTWVNDFQDTSEESRFIGSLALTYKFNIKGLKYKLQAGGNIRNKERRRFYGLTTFQGSSTNGSLSISNLESKSYQINNLLTYNRTFNKKHRINAVIGMTYDVRDIKNTLYAVNDFSTTEFGVDQPIYGQQISRPLDVLPLKSQLLSYLSRVNYSFDNKYIITGTFRADGSSKFSKENRYSYFPSFSLAWRANNENFLKNSDTINDLKFRIGWGMTGNQGISAYQTFANYGPILYGNSDEGTNIGFVPLNVSNPNLKWETTKQLNFGLDFGLWKNRVTGTLDIYDKQTDDLLLNQPPDY